MANEEQLRILKKEGVEVWNKWREDNPDVEIDLSGANLLAYLRKADLKGANLEPLTLKQRCVGALKAGGETAIEEFLDNPYVNVGKAVVKGWMKPE